MFFGILLEQKHDEWRMDSNVLDLPLWHNQDNRVIHRDGSWRDWSTIQATVLVRFLAELVWVVSRVGSLISVLLSSSSCRSSEKPEEHLRISASQYTPGLSGIFSDFPFEFWCICHVDDISHREPRLVRNNLERNNQDRWRNDSLVLLTDQLGGKHRWRYPHRTPVHCRCSSMVDFRLNQWTEPNDRSDRDVSCNSSVTKWYDRHWPVSRDAALPNIEWDDRYVASRETEQRRDRDASIITQVSNSNRPFWSRRTVRENRWFYSTDPLLFRIHFSWKRNPWRSETEAILDCSRVLMITELFEDLCHALFARSILLR